MKGFVMALRVWEYDNVLYKQIVLNRELLMYNIGLHKDA